jgi:choline kinase
VRAIIIAAGLGSRLWPVTRKVPKTLLPFTDATILAHILGNFAAIGVRRFTVVVGFRGDLIRDYLAANRDFGHEIALVENPEWERGNGLSVLAARALAAEPGLVFLSMSDHLVHPDALRALAADPRKLPLLLTDARIDAVYDIDDATKVQQTDGRITGIGKELATYNAVDTGVFRVDAHFMDALAEAAAEGEESISAGVRRLVSREEMGASPFPEGLGWIDIDTPEAYAAAQAEAVRYLGGAAVADEGGAPVGNTGGAAGLD